MTTEELVVFEKIMNLMYPNGYNGSQIEMNEENMTLIKSINTDVFPPSRLMPILSFIKDHTNLVKEILNVSSS